MAAYWRRVPNTCEKYELVDDEHIAYSPQALGTPGIQGWHNEKVTFKILKKYILFLGLSLIVWKMKGLLISFSVIVQPLPVVP